MPLSRPARHDGAARHHRVGTAARAARESLAAIAQWRPAPADRGTHPRQPPRRPVSEPGAPGRAWTRDTFLAPDAALLARLRDAAAGTLTMMTLAPELPGAGALIRDLRAHRVVASLGHTDADYPDVAAAAAGRGSIGHPPLQRYAWPTPPRAGGGGGGARPRGAQRRADLRRRPRERAGPAPGAPGQGRRSAYG